MRVENIPFPISVLLGEAFLPMAHYHELRIGDILVLDQKIEESLLVRVGVEARYRATAGLFENHKAVTIDGRIYS